MCMSCDVVLCHVIPCRLNPDGTDAQIGPIPNSTRAQQYIEEQGESKSLVPGRRWECGGMSQTGSSVNNPLPLQP